MKKITIMITIICFFLIASEDVLAGNFSHVASTGILNLSNNQAWEKSYRTSQGKFKIRFRKLWTASDQKKYHLIIWWNDKRIADGYCPKVSSGYSFDIFHEDVTGRIFVSLATRPRVVLMGYEPMNGRLETYIDSKNYGSLRIPRLSIDEDKDISLYFQKNNTRDSGRYKFFWDESNRWFGYRDMTVVTTSTMLEADQDAGLWTGYSDNETYEEESDSYAYTGNLYYEETVVVGS